MDVALLFSLIGADLAPKADKLAGFSGAEQRTCIEQLHSLSQPADETISLV
jgi:hypothetical protein